MEYKDVGKRIRERLIALRYVKPDGELDIERFSWDQRLGRTNLYNWIGDKAVPFKDLTRLCDALGCSEVWLLEGRERDPKAQPANGRQHRKTLRAVLLALSVAAGHGPSAGVAAEAHMLLVAKAPNAVLLIGSWRRRFLMFASRCEFFTFRPALA